MISVIIPTIWSAKEIDVMLPKVNDHSLVSEIILIDNRPELSHEHKDVCRLSKLKYKTFGENIYPVRSWNYGWETSLNDKLVFLNDDVVFSIALFDFIHDIITEENGMITVNADSVQQPTKDLILHREVPASAMSTEQCKRLRHKAAIFFGIHKNCYVSIPEELKIHHNDTFLWKICEKNGKKNLSINGAELRTQMSVSVKQFPKIVKEDSKNMPSVFAKYGLNTNLR